MVLSTCRLLLMTAVSSVKILGQTIGFMTVGLPMAVGMRMMPEWVLVSLIMEICTDTDKSKHSNNNKQLHT